MREAALKAMRVKNISGNSSLQLASCISTMLCLDVPIDLAFDGPKQREFFLGYTKTGVLGAGINHISIFENHRCFLNHELILYRSNTIRLELSKQSRVIKQPNPAMKQGLRWIIVLFRPLRRLNFFPLFVDAIKTSLQVFSLQLKWCLDPWVYKYMSRAQPLAQVNELLNAKPNSWPIWL